MKHFYNLFIFWIGNSLQKRRLYENQFYSNSVSHAAADLSPDCEPNASSVQRAHPSSQQEAHPRALCMALFRPDWQLHRKSINSFVLFM